LISSKEFVASIYKLGGYTKQLKSDRIVCFLTLWPSKLIRRNIYS